MADYRPKMGSEEVAGDTDLSGKLVVVTGGSAGLGIETIRVLAKCGAKVVSTVRDQEKGQIALETVKKSVPDADVELAILDLFDLDSVRKCGKEIAENFPKIDILINNAGVMAAPLSRTKEGLEIHLGTNFLGHYVFTKYLINNVIQAAPSRIINLTSSAHRLSPYRLDDPFFEKEEYHKLTAYGQSKTASVLFALELDRRYKDRGVRTTAVHPGLINTELGRHFSEEEVAFLQTGIPEGLSMKDVSQGAATTVWAATTPDFDNLAGKFCEDCAVADEIDDPDEHERGVMPHALDMGVAATLWDLGEQWSGEKFPD
ncbi:MAG: short-chain dehydrogenase [Gammaproteobacteria bacterium]|mgnify:CR=1 FL=1|jgi:NAD(P)-dependent dehydrogenase (short-subunit alcohol dehydrogenase family)|nr:short-chain dehydrogenase [Gammaproteobacteria bacterium]|tara:strand:+ start:16056 stop:17003 length:948 start_codon:yes stop_codon:yes gene_type:complete